MTVHVDFPIELSEAQKRIVKGWSNDMFSSYDDDNDDNDNDRGYDNTMENEMVDEEDTDVDDINLEIELK